jgi:hypothetical protein
LIVSILIGVASFDACRSTFVVSWGTVDAVAAGSSAAIALSVAGSADSIKSEVVGGASLHACSIEGVSLTDRAGGTVLGVDCAGGTAGVAGSTLVDWGLVESISAIEGADTSDHHVWALGVAGTVVKNLAGRAGSAGSIGSKTAGTVEGAVLAGTVDGVSADRARGETLEVEE